MKYCYRLLTILLSFLLLGCPLESKYPLGDNRSVPIDQRYIGKWVVTELGLSSKETMLVFPFNENEYFIETSVIGGDKVSRFRAYLSIIDNVQLLNIQDLEENISERKYGFIKIHMGTNGLLTLWVVEDNLLSNKHPSKDELIQYVKDNIQNDNVYKKLASFKRHVQ